MRSGALKRRFAAPRPPVRATGGGRHRRAAMGKNGGLVRRMETECGNGTACVAGGGEDEKVRSTPRTGAPGNPVFGDRSP